MICEIFQITFIFGKYRRSYAAATLVRYERDIQEVISDLMTLKEVEINVMEVKSLEYPPPWSV